MDSKKILHNFLNFAKKLTFLDYLIIIAVLLFGIILFKFFNPEEKWIDVTILDEKVPIYQLGSLKVGDIEKDPNGKKIAEISKIESFDNSNIALGKDLFIDTKLLVKINPRSKEYEYKNKIIKVGSPIEVRFNNNLIGGILSSIGKFNRDENKVTKILTLKMYEQWPWFADSIKVGDAEIEENGEKLVEILSKEVVPAEITVDNASGQKILTTDPQKVDITLKVKVQAQKYGDEYIFKKDKRIIVGDLYSFNAGRTKIKDASIINSE